MLEASTNHYLTKKNVEENCRIFRIYFKIVQPLGVSKINYLILNATNLKLNGNINLKSFQF